MDNSYEASGSNSRSKIRRGGRKPKFGNADVKHKTEQHSDRRQSKDKTHEPSSHSDLTRQSTPSAARERSQSGTKVQKQGQTNNLKTQNSSQKQHNQDKQHDYEEKTARNRNPDSKSSMNKSKQWSRISTIHPQANKDESRHTPNVSPPNKQVIQVPTKGNTPSVYRQTTTIGKNDNKTKSSSMGQEKQRLQGNAKGPFQKQRQTTPDQHHRANHNSDVTSASHDSRQTSSHKKGSEHSYHVVKGNNQSQITTGNYSRKPKISVSGPVRSHDVVRPDGTSQQKSMVRVTFVNVTL